MHKGCQTLTLFIKITLFTITNYTSTVRWPIQQVPCLVLPTIILLAVRHGIVWHGRGAAWLCGVVWCVGLATSAERWQCPVVLPLSPLYHYTILVRRPCPRPPVPVSACRPLLLLLLMLLVLVLVLVLLHRPWHCPLLLPLPHTHRHHAILYHAMS